MAYRLLTEFERLLAGRVARDYGAMLVRMSVDYDRRFATPADVQSG